MMHMLSQHEDVPRARYRNLDLLSGRKRVDKLALQIEPLVGPVIRIPVAQGSRELIGLS
jgi:hypothetical protein